MPEAGSATPKAATAFLRSAGNVADRVLDLMRMDVLTGADDDVLDSAGDEEVAAGHVGAVAGVEPSVVEQLPRLGRIMEIARSRRWPAEFEATFLPFAEFPPDIVNDANLVVGDRLAAGDDLDELGAVVGPAGSAIPLRAQASSG